ncbi:PfkA1 [Desulforapulum autotrophicum HRM2]|uniref:PfkA1 n=1 Tax=Desulforapulum autotrophicum (strain ATCC 43914 / DSM 3382 / VKM B-1955 / HRM2) TaxID=177437 RepID=C0QDP6_DESAH|nr:penicillin-binding protein activator [Desulforapulum autotrophicum]ACN15310.1 PfkA1 [Desulforapulum autotrophicum HRM2]
MKTRNNRLVVVPQLAVMPQVVVVLLLAVALVMLTSCGVKPPLAPGVEISEPQVEEAPAVVSEKTEAETAFELAQGLEEKGLVVDVLRLYAKALKFAPEHEKDRVRSSLNRFLATVDTAELEGIAASEDASFPRAEILYRLGLNYGSQGNNQLAIDTFVRFLQDHPDHQDGENARQLVLLLQEHLFKKNSVGCLLPLSGRFSIFGERALKGIELAVQDFSNQYHVKINVLIKDTRSDNDQTVTCVQELAAEKVAGIAGPIITAEVAGQTAQHLGLPLIAMTQKTQVARDGEYVFSNFLTPEIQTQALASYASRMLQVKKFAILYPDDRYGRTYMNLFMDKVIEMGGEILGAESYGKDQTDFSDAIKKLTRQFSRQSSFASTAFFIPDSPGKVGMILPQLAYHDITGCYLLGTNLWHDDSLITSAKKYAVNTVITDGFFANGMNLKAKAFAERFRSLYGEDPGFLEAVAYDTLTMLVQTAMEPGVNSRADLRAGLSDKRVFEGVTGRTMFDPDGNAQKELVFITIKQGEFRELSR